MANDVTELTPAEAKLEASCKAQGRDFIAALRMARSMAEGNLTMDQCVTLVTQAMTPSSGVTTKTALEAFRAELAQMDAAEAQAMRAVNDIKRKRAELQRVVNALDEIVGNPGKYDCPDCGRPCRNVRSLSIHRSRMHKAKLVRAVPA